MLVFILFFLYIKTSLFTRKVLSSICQFVEKGYCVSLRRILMARSQNDKSDHKPMTTTAAAVSYSAVDCVQLTVFSDIKGLGSKTRRVGDCSCLLSNILLLSVFCTMKSGLRNVHSFVRLQFVSNRVQCHMLDQYSFLYHIFLSKSQRFCLLF